jgi:hypothetical protein
MAADAFFVPPGSEGNNDLAEVAVDQVHDQTAGGKRPGGVGQTEHRGLLDVTRSPAMTARRAMTVVAARWRPGGRWRTV